MRQKALVAEETTKTPGSIQISDSEVGCPAKRADYGGRSRAGGWSDTELPAANPAGSTVFPSRKNGSSQGRVGCIDRGTPGKRGGDWAPLPGGLGPIDSGDTSQAEPAAECWTFRYQLMKLASESIHAGLVGGEGGGWAPSARFKGKLVPCGCVGSNGVA